MFEMTFDRPVEKVIVVQLNAELIEVDFFCPGDILQYSRVIPIYSYDKPQPVDPEVVFAREQWNNLI